MDEWLYPQLYMKYNYRETSSINRTKSQNLNISCLLLQWVVFAQPIEASC